MAKGKTHVIDGVEYVEVEREAKVGEKVIIVDAWDYEDYKNGEIYEMIEDEDGDASTPKGWASSSEYRVLEPVEQAESSPDVYDLLANLAARVSELEKRVDEAEKRGKVTVELAAKLVFLLRILLPASTRGAR